MQNEWIHKGSISPKERRLSCKGCGQTGKPKLWGMSGPVCAEVKAYMARAIC